MIRFDALLLLILGIMADVAASQWLLDTLQYAAFMIVVVLIILLILASQWRRERQRKDY